MVTLPALTMHDPWARLLMAGIKTIETRRGPVLSRFSGPLVIHRSKTPAMDPEPFLEPLGLSMPPVPDGWPEDYLGCLMGVVYVEKTWKLSLAGDPDCSRLDPAGKADLVRRACFPDICNRYMSEVTRATWFPKPIPARGKQGRWRAEVPGSILPDWAVPTPDTIDLFGAGA